MNAIIQYWYFHLPNYVLMAAIIAVLVRLALSVFVAKTSHNLLWRVTEPLLNVTRFITPAGLPEFITPVFCVLWLVLLRVTLILTLGSVT